MITLIAVALLAVPAAAAATPPDPAEVTVDHLPVAEVPAGQPIVLTAKVQNGHLLAAFELHWRPRGGSWSVVPFGKEPEGGYAAVIEAKDALPPSIDYYLTSRELAQPELNRFGSAALPHPVLVHSDVEDLERQARLTWHKGHTSSAQVVADYVDFGTHGGLNDRYYQVEASYQYLLLGFVQHIKLGIGTLRGDVPPPLAPGRATGGEPGRHTGLDYGNGELAFNPGGQIGLTGRMILGADELGFATGFAGMMRIGRETFAHVELGGQFIQRFGYDAVLRLAWDTVPRWPIGFAVHVTNTPSAPVRPGSTPDNPLTDGGAPTGIRALLDAGFEATPNLTVLLKGGYQARFSTAGAISLGAGLQVGW